MFNARSIIAKTKQFVKEHPTLTACAATAVVTAKVVHDKDINRLQAIAAELLLDKDQQMNLLLDITSFVDSKGLREEFLAFTPRQ